MIFLLVEYIYVGKGEKLFILLLKFTEVVEVSGKYVKEYI